MKNSFILSTGQAAYQLQLTKSLLRQLCASGFGPPYKKLGRFFRFRQIDLDNYSLRLAAIK